uniref:G-protein coupled receptors family 1 profile domain-containing protein n=1 Tax=Globodera rostochiensis TaxID=31243 RepID=A0A914H4X5_GLORO
MLFFISLAEQSSTVLAIGTASVSRLSSPQFTTHSANVAGGAANGATAANQQPSNRVCLGFADILIAFILILLILATVLGNVLVVLSVFLYKRMRTFTNFLLTSLATADLLVGLLIMPLALFDLLHNHNWPLGKALCRIWATFDVLLCTASILNLCIISLDRYMAITSPLRYPRTRSRWMACALLSFVPLLATADASALARLSLTLNKMPMLSSTVSRGHREQTTTALLLGDGAYQCAYPMSVSYRIYSASVSFYIPLVVMLFVYFKIFRVASERERLIREGMGTCRLSRRVEKTQLKGRKRSATTNYTRRSNAPRIHEVIQNIASPTLTACGGEQDKNSSANHCSAPAYSKHPSRPNPTPGALPPAQLSEDRPSSGQMSPNLRSSILRPGDYDSEETICPPSARTSGRSATPAAARNGTKKATNILASSQRCATDSFRRKIKSMECLGTLGNYSSRVSTNYRKNSADPAGDDSDDDESDMQNECQQQRRVQDNNNKFAQRSLQNLQNLQPPAPVNRLSNGAKQLMRTANNNNTFGMVNCTTGSNQQARNSMAVLQQSHFTTKNANFRGSKEKIVYLRERKALKTIGIVVLGFIICWLPFFVVYVLEVSPVLKKWDVIGKKEFQLLSEFFLWLGYSNSVLNPLIYTMYNSDFRRCFRDLLGMGCMNQHRRTMSVKKLHQQSNLF